MWYPFSWSKTQPKTNMASSSSSSTPSDVKRTSVISVFENCGDNSDYERVCMRVSFKISDDPKWNHRTCSITPIPSNPQDGEPCANCGSCGLNNFQKVSVKERFTDLDEEIWLVCSPCGNLKKVETLARFDSKSFSRPSGIATIESCDSDDEDLKEACQEVLNEVKDDLCVNHAKGVGKMCAAVHSLEDHKGNGECDRCGSIIIRKITSSEGVTVVCDRCGNIKFASESSGPAVPVSPIGPSGRIAETPENCVGSIRCNDCRSLNVKKVEFLRDGVCYICKSCGRVRKGAVENMKDGSFSRSVEGCKDYKEPFVSSKTYAERAASYIDTRARSEAQTSETSKAESSEDIPTIKCRDCLSTRIYKVERAGYEGCSYICRNCGKVLSAFGKCKDPSVNSLPACERLAHLQRAPQTITRLDSSMPGLPSELPILPSPMPVPEKSSSSSSQSLKPREYTTTSKVDPSLSSKEGVRRFLKAWNSVVDSYTDTDGIGWERDGNKLTLRVFSNGTAELYAQMDGAKSTISLPPNEIDVFTSKFDGLFSRVLSEVTYAFLASLVILKKAIGDDGLNDELAKFVADEARQVTQYIVTHDSSITNSFMELKRAAFYARFDFELKIKQKFFDKYKQSVVVAMIDPSKVAKAFAKSQRCSLGLGLAIAKNATPLTAIVAKTTIDELTTLEQVEDLKYVGERIKFNTKALAREFAEKNPNK